MRVHVVSVPHTGTHFTLEVLRRSGVRWERRIHTTQEGWQDSFAPGVRVVVPMRLLALVVASALNRGEPVRISDFNEIAKLRTSDTHFFRVDCEDADRRAELDKLGDFLDCDMADVDWAPLNSRKDVLDLKGKCDVIDQLYSRAVSGAEIQAVLGELGYKTLSRSDCGCGEVAA